MYLYHSALIYLRSNSHNFTAWCINLYSSGTFASLRSSRGTFYAWPLAPFCRYNVSYS